MRRRPVEIRAAWAATCDVPAASPDAAASRRYVSGETPARATAPPARTIASLGSTSDAIARPIDTSTRTTDAMVRPVTQRLDRLTHRSNQVTQSFDLETHVWRIRQCFRRGPGRRYVLSKGM